MAHAQEFRTDHARAARIPSPLLMTRRARARRGECSPKQHAAAWGLPDPLENVAARSLAKTVSAHLQDILSKLGVSRRAEIAAWAATVATRSEVAEAR